MTLALVVLLALLMTAGIPLFAALAGFALLGYHDNGTDPSTLVIEMDRVASAPSLVAIPLFTLAGYMMAESRTPDRMIRLARSLVGWMPGGVAIAAVISCAFFTAFTGASGVTIIALGGLLYPMLVREKYSEKFSLGLLTTGGSLGLLFPPSLPVILYAIVAGIDTEKLYSAALLPAVLLCVFIAGYSILSSSRDSQSHRHPFSMKELTAALVDARFELPLPIAILVGIYGGFLTANEAAILTVVIVFVVEVILYRDVKLTALPKIAERSMILVGAILLILGVALGLTNYMVLEEVPDKILTAIQTHVSGRYTFLIALNLFLLVVGCLLDIFSAIIVVVPLIMPMAKAYGVDPLHLGVIFLANLEIGYLTPPVGMNLFLSSFRFRKPLPEVYSAAVPFIVVLLLALIVITYVPALSLGLVGVTDVAR